MATRGRRRTWSAPRLAAAARPSRAGVSRSPARASSSPVAEIAAGRADIACRARRLGDADRRRRRARRSPGSRSAPRPAARRRRSRSAPPCPARRCPPNGAPAGRLADHAQPRAGDRILVAHRIAVHRRDRIGRLVPRRDDVGGERAPAAVARAAGFRHRPARRRRAAARAPRRARAGSLPPPVARRAAGLRDQLDPLDRHAARARI